MSRSIRGVRRDCGVTAWCLLLLVSGAELQAQSALPYQRTFFLSGLGDLPSTWNQARQSLSQSLELGTAVHPSLGSEYGYDVGTQKSFLSMLIAADTGKVVLVGHSFGGLVARATTQLPAMQNKVFGIVTVATPIRGARVAAPANFNLLEFRVVDALRRVGDVAAVFGSRPWVLAQLSRSDSLGSGLSKLFPKNTPAWNDIQPFNQTVMDINMGAGPNIPVAQVMGDAPPGWIHYRLAASKLGHPSTWQYMAVGDQLFRLGCNLVKGLSYAMIATISVGRRCGFAINTLEKIDVTFNQTVKGQTLLQQMLFPKKSDGVVAADDAAWIGWGDMRAVLTAEGQDHISIQYTPTGVQRVREAMSATGVISK